MGVSYASKTIDHKYAGSEVLTAVPIKSTVFWDVRWFSAV
jgi:hypothetical protein